MTPNHWKEVPFHTLFRRVGKRSGYENEELLSVYRDYGVVRKADRNDNFNRPGKNLSDYQLVMPGDLVLNKMKTWQGSLGISNYQGIVSPAYFIYEPVSDNDPSFLHFYLRSQPAIDFYASHSSGIRVNQWDLIPEELSKMKVPLPPLGEQRAISTYIGKETAEIDSTVADLDEYISLLEKRKKVQIQNSVEGTPAPLHCMSRIVDCVHTTPKSEESEIYAESVRTSSIRDGKFIPGQGIAISKATLESRNRDITPEPGDVFFTREAPAGEACLVPANGRYTMGQRVVCIRPDRTRLLPDYLVHCLYSQKAQEHFLFNSNGSTVTNIKMATIGQTRIQVPSLERQQEIVDEVNKELSQTDSIISDCKELRDLLVKRKQTLITEVVTGRKEI